MAQAKRRAAKPENDWPDGQNPALVPDPPPPPTEGTYKVVGTQRTLDHDPGETFTATLSPEQEEALVWGGHIKRVKEAR